MTRHINLALFALALSAFGIGTTEFVIMGILPQVSHSLDVSIPSAGLLVSFYALGVAVGAPILAVLTKNFSRKKALLTLMFIFIIGNIGCALSFHYGVMMLARILTSFCHGSFFGIGAYLGGVPLSLGFSANACIWVAVFLALLAVLACVLKAILAKTLWKQHCQKSDQK